ncbi:MAG: HPr kinase/phosphorylase [Anaerolineae bacterium]
MTDTSRTALPAAVGTGCASACPANPEFAMASDALGRTAPLVYQAAYPLLGKPVLVRSNSPVVLHAAEQSFSGWRRLEPCLIEEGSPLTVDVIVHPGERGPGPFVQRFHGACYLAASGADVLTAQVDDGRALAFVTPALAADAPALRHQVLECLALLLATRHDRTPLHAGAVVARGTAVLLAGRSLAGKSTLTYACLRQGMRLLADDVVYVSRRGGLRLWGQPSAVHLLPDAANIFPELADTTPRVQANGKVKITVDVARLGPDSVSLHAERAVVCLLRRGDSRHSGLHRVGAEEAVAAFCRDLESGFDLLPADEALVRALAGTGTYVLEVGSDLAEAASLTEQIALRSAGG